MPVRQKVFRIEMMQSSGTAADEADATVPHEDVLTELKALRDLFEQRLVAAPPIQREGMTADDLSKLKVETDTIHRAISRTMHELASLHFGTRNAHASRELDAVANGTEQATQQILDAAEAIDEAANTLSATLKHAQERALASDIRDQVVRIFEACNFQDLGGQRIVKVLATLQFVEDRVARMMEIWSGNAELRDHAVAAIGERSHDGRLVSGPKLDDEPGHATQSEIDALFT